TARVAALGGPLVIVTLLAGVMAWQAHRADRAHRATARETVQDHVDFAAILLEAELERVMAGAMAYAFAAERRSTDSLPGPEVFLGDAQEQQRCTDVYGPGDRYFFRVLLPTGTVEVAGGARPEVRTWLADTIPVLAATAYGTNQDYAHVFATVAGHREAVAYRLRRDPDGVPVAAYGFNTCFADYQGPILPRLTRRVRLLPPSLTGPVPADSLLTVTVTDPTGAVLYRSAAEYASDFTGVSARRATDLFGGVRLAVTLRPEAADRLVIGGLPPSRAPLLAGLLVLTGLLASLSLLQLLRTLELVRLRERFVDDVSHELRTPLQQILLFLQLVRLGRVRSDDERDRAVEIAERETRRLI
ncbi:MAG TPA: histidine kinase dimerization/phospho-acceptor domain-containing protein, partial [Longimicrobiales bacterium]|nr:histidine kinase dimerization/phospho-acceptor domain-containing protein [Longimicrobiales bacterium]